MNQNLIHTPVGVRDIYGKEYSRKLLVENKIHYTIESYGYEGIQTPGFEFFDVFSKEIGTTNSRELYKFFDKEGNTLVLRPDFTPSIARCAAKYFQGESNPIRFCYQGNTYTNTSDLQGKLKEMTETGAELINDGSVEADAEMIAMVVDSLLASGLKDFQISVGEVNYFKGLCKELNIDEEKELQLRDYISIKNQFGAQEYLINENMSQIESEKFLKIFDLYGQSDILEIALENVNNSRSKTAICRLQNLYQKLCLYGVEKYVSFDLGMLSKYHYYTGVIFKAYTYGVGDAIVKGGRYDTLLSKFGKESSAIGFVILIDDLMSALSRQKLDIEVNDNMMTIYYNANNYNEKLKEAIERRNNGEKIKLAMEQA